MTDTRSTRAAALIRPVFAAALALALAALLPAGAAAEPRQWQRMGFETDFSRTTVPFSEIVAGGPPKDGIPSIDEPVFVAAHEADAYVDREPVIEIVVEGLEPRAYPLSVLIWHEIVNDTIDGRALAITYCPLCNSAVVFEREVDGQTTTFGTTGLLRHSDLVMYDRATETWWQQFTGEAIVGTHAGERLTMVPSRVVSFAEFRERHPDGRVLVPNDLRMRPYGRNPYVGYDAREAPYPLYTGTLPETIEPMARVVVARRGETVIPVALSHLREQGEVEANGAILRWREGVGSVLDAASIAQGREVGAVEVEDATSGAPLVHDITFAFVVHAFHPEAQVLTEDGWITLSE